MCLALVNPYSTLPYSYFTEAATNNGDGMGLLYIEDGVLKTFKTLDVNTFYQFYLDLRKPTHSMLEAGQTPNVLPMLLHWRWATHGEKGLLNCHPFMVNPNVGFIHNGIFSGLPHDDQLSDTQVLNRDVLQQLPADFLDNQALRDVLFDYCDRNSSKLCFLESDGSISIFNKKAGHEDADKNWFSNYSYTPRTYKSYGNYSSYGTISKKSAGNALEPMFEGATVYSDSWCAKSRTNPPSRPVAAAADFDEDLQDDDGEIVGDIMQMSEADFQAYLERKGLGGSQRESDYINSMLASSDNHADDIADDYGISYNSAFIDIDNQAHLYIEELAAENELDNEERKFIRDQFCGWHNANKDAGEDETYDAINTMFENFFGDVITFTPDPDSPLGQLEATVQGAD